MDSAVTARRNARWEPGTGAKIFRPLVCLADPHEPSGFCLSKRKSHPLSSSVESRKGENRAEENYCSCFQSQLRQRKGDKIKIRPAK